MFSFASSFSTVDKLKVFEVVVFQALVMVV